MKSVWHRLKRVGDVLNIILSRCFLSMVFPSYVRILIRASPTFYYRDFSKHVQSVLLTLIVSSCFERPQCGTLHMFRDKHVMGPASLPWYAGKTGELAVMVLYSPDDRPAMPGAEGDGECPSRKQAGRVNGKNSNADRGEPEQGSGGDRRDAFSHTVVVFLVDLKVSSVTVFNFNVCN